MVVLEIQYKIITVEKVVIKGKSSGLMHPHNKTYTCLAKKKRKKERNLYLKKGEKQYYSGVPKGMYCDRC